MKTASLILMILTVASGCATQRAAMSPFDLPPGVTYEVDESTDYRSFRWGTDDTMALFMMFPHPAGLDRAMVDKMAEDAESQLPAAMRGIEGSTRMETTTRAVSAGAFTGKAIVCKLTMDDGKTVYQTMHILWDGNRLWQGQLSGTTEDDLKMVETILKSRRSDLRTNR